jgi:hypothetical protein
MSSSPFSVFIGAGVGDWQEQLIVNFKVGVIDREHFLFFLK